MHDDLTPPFNLIHRLGWTRAFEDMPALAAFTAENRVYVSEHHVERYYDPRLEGFPHVLVYDWIVRDDRGLAVTADQIRSANPARSPSRSELRLLAAVHARFLGLPIPGTGRKRGYRPWTVTRRPSLRHVVRQQVLEADVPAEHRPRKRLPKVLELWDRWESSGVPRSDARDRNWKRHRRTQWKE